MPPFRNPFGKKPPPLNGSSQDDNAQSILPNGADSISKRSDLTTTSRTSSALSIKPNKEEPNEFKLSVVNDSGVYLPPSPPDQKSFWRRTPTSTTSSSHRSALSENEPFSISRESFDSYRRSFDISARSPIIHPSPPPARQSLDSPFRNPLAPRSALHNNLPRFFPPQPTSEEPYPDDEGFEDVGLDDPSHPSKYKSSNTFPYIREENVKPPQPRRKGLFSRFADPSSEPPPSASEDNPSSRPGSSHRGFHLPGRKRGQSGQGAELGSMAKPAVVGGLASSTAATPVSSTAAALAMAAPTPPVAPKIVTAAPSPEATPAPVAGGGESVEAAPSPVSGAPGNVEGVIR